jgi:hypothetical protein
MMCFYDAIDPSAPVTYWKTDLATYSRINAQSDFSLMFNRPSGGAGHSTEIVLEAPTETSLLSRTMLVARLSLQL